MAHTNRGSHLGQFAGWSGDQHRPNSSQTALSCVKRGRDDAALGKPAQLSADAIVIFNIWGLRLGIAAVWLYAAIRPRYGAGPTTAIRAGLFTWAVAVFLANLGNYPLGLFPTRLLVITSIVALVEIVVATLVGAWLYKEEEVVSQVVYRAAA